FDMKRNAQIFWSPLLIGHALLSDPAAHRMPWRSFGRFSGMCGYDTRGFWPLRGRAHGPVLD
ncbi:MAG TPA: hypothetical protein VGH39_16215, partial [Xanthobacteraceae bacterium]